MPIPPTLLTAIAHVEQALSLSSASFPSIARSIASQSLTSVSGAAQASLGAPTIISQGAASVSGASEITALALNDAGSATLLEAADTALGIPSDASLRTALSGDLREAALEQIRQHAEAVRQSAEIAQERQNQSRERDHATSEPKKRSKLGFLSPDPLFPSLFSKTTPR